MALPNIIQNHTNDINTIKSTYLPLSGGTLTGAIDCASNKYSETTSNEEMVLSNYGINLRNSDIIGVNGLYFNDAANSYEEGINFPDGTNLYSTILATGGALYFTPKRTFATAGTKQRVVTIGAQSTSATGYRKYADGFIEQWGRIAGSTSGNVTITFPTAFSNTNYHISGNILNASDNNAVYIVKFRELTATNCKAAACYYTSALSYGGAGIMWYACGF